LLVGLGGMRGRGCLPKKENSEGGQSILN
jgi:hypothetical protein